MPRAPPARFQLRGSTRTSMDCTSGCAARRLPSSSISAKRSRAHQAADSANTTSVPSRSLTPETRAWISAGR